MSPSGIYYLARRNVPLEDLKVTNRECCGPRAVFSSSWPVKGGEIVVKPKGTASVTPSVVITMTEPCEITSRLPAETSNSGTNWPGTPSPCLNSNPHHFLQNVLHGVKCTDDCSIRDGLEDLLDLLFVKRHCRMSYRKLDGSLLSEIPTNQSSP